MRRRAVTNRLVQYRHRLWPEATRRHGRRRPRVDETTFPPAPVVANEIWGVELRHTIVALLRAHGELTLRELHGLLHLCGFAVAGPRPVQSLADAAGYETREGRLTRVRRGVYAPSYPFAPVAPRADPWPWEAPDDLGSAMVDFAAAHDAERWSGGGWPGTVQSGSEILGGDPVEDVRERAQDVQACRERVAALLRPSTRVRPADGGSRSAPTRPSPSRPPSRPRPSDPPPDGPVPAQPRVPTASPPDPADAPGPPPLPNPLGPDSSTNRGLGVQNGCLGEESNPGEAGLDP